MFKDVFQSINESIKKRNNPEDFFPKKKNTSEEDIIHRGYLKTAEYPIKYSFMPDGKENSNSGTHIYHFKDKNINGIVDISYKFNPSMSGHETKSHVRFENLGKDKLEPIDLHRIIFPIINHHVKSHDPDIITFDKSIRYADDIIRRIGSNYLMSKTESDVMAKKNIDPKTKRIISHIKKKLNNSKEN